MSKGNLSQIFETPEYLSIATVAKIYGFNRPTLSKWLNGKQQPENDSDRAVLEEIKKNYDYVPGQGLLERRK